MYTTIPTQKSCARAWAAAASIVADKGEAYNVIIDVEQPDVFDSADNAAISIVDEFLHTHGEYPITTVANTLFPQQLYQRYGSPAFYGEYLKVVSSLKKTKGWGRYFERMIRERGPTTKRFSPLPDLIAKIRKQQAKGKCVRATHELAIYDPRYDRNRWRGGPCLSFLSFKWHPDDSLALTATYRNHTYVTRCLGNLIGLGRLLAFVAHETSLNVGSLTCISTHAELDAGKWGKGEARKMINKASALLADPAQITLIGSPEELTGVET